MFQQFKDDLEHLLIAEGVKARLSHWVKEAEERHYGRMIAFDRALSARDDDQLAAALWKNIYAPDGNPASVQEMLRYVSRELACLALTDLPAVLTANIAFSDDFGAFSDVAVDAATASTAVDAPGPPAAAGGDPSAHSR